MRNLFVFAAWLAASSVAAWAQPVDVAPTIESARRAAQANRNEEAATLFGQAIAQSPQGRRDWLAEYADQLVYSGRAAGAVPLYQEILQSPRSDAERLQALKGLGLAWLWTDRPSAARPIYELVLREQPADADASRNLGRALSWGGRQREAIEHLRRHLLRHPGDEEARVQMAQALAWMGRPDQARATLKGLGGADARRLDSALERDLAPRTTVGGQRSTQSDNLEIRAARAQQTFTFDQGRGMAGVRVERFDYELEGADGARVTRPMVLARYRFSDGWEWNGEAGRQRTRSGGGPDTEFTAHNTWLTWWPDDQVRVDFSSARGDFDNLRSLRMGLTHRDQGVSVDYTPTERLRATVRLQRSAYSDGNRRAFGQLEGEYRWRTHPEVWAGLRYTRFEFDRQLDNGYFNPLRFQSLLGTLRLAWRPAGDDAPWEVNAYAAYGREHAVPDGDKPAYDVSLRAAWRIDPRTRFELRAQRFSSRTSSSAGFSRTVLGAQLERSW